MSTFAEIADDPFAEALDFRLSFRDSGNNLIVLTDLEHGLSAPAITRERERQFNTIQAFQWTVRLSSSEALIRSVVSGDVTELAGRWAVIEVGFRDANLWRVEAQGRIQELEVDSDGSALFTIVDPLYELVNTKLPRDVCFDDRAGHAGPMRDVARSNMGFDNAGNPCYPAQTGAAAEIMPFESFLIEFLDERNFQVILEDGSIDPTSPHRTNQTRTIASLYNGLPWLTIPSAGWSNASGAYAAGDRFTVSLSPKQPDGAFTPIVAIQKILEDTIGLKSYDVLAGTEQSIYWNIWHWANLIADTASYAIRGAFAKDESAIALVQSLLVLVNGSLYPSRTGQIGIHIPGDKPSEALELRGDPPNVSILSVRDKTALREVFNAVTFNFGNIYDALVNGTMDIYGENTRTFYDADSIMTYGTRAPNAIRVGWAPTPLEFFARATRVLRQLAYPSRELLIQATLRQLGELDLASRVSITDRSIGANAQPAEVNALSVSVDRNTLELVAYVDPLVTDIYAQVDLSVIDDPERVIF